jgi:hypothetical protein
MPEWFTPVISAIIGGGGVGGIGLLIRVKSDVKKVDADAASVLSDAAMELLLPYREELKHAREELAAARNEIATLRGEVAHTLSAFNIATAELDEYRRIHGPLSN